MERLWRFYKFPILLLLAFSVSAFIASFLLQSQWDHLQFYSRAPNTNFRKLAIKEKTKVELVVVVCGENRTDEALTMIKSALIFSRDVQLNFILFLDSSTENIFPPKVNPAKCF